MKTLFTISKQVQAPYLARARIFLLLRWRRRVLFFFHFQRILAVLFLNGCCLDIFNCFGLIIVWLAMQKKIECQFPLDKISGGLETSNHPFSID